MDNVTHTLVGVVLGHSPRTQDRDFRKALVWAAALGSNLPDFDFLLSAAVGGGKLAYLLHHRGHTHTLILAPLLALITTAVAMKIARLSWSRALPVYLMAVVASILHIAMDGMNDYGVHPFWPFLNRWFYGDFIFIIEPLLLFVLLPFAFFKSEAKWAKALIITIAFGLFGLMWLGPFMPWSVALWTTAWAFGFAWTQKLRTSLIPVFSGVAVVLGVFLFASTRVDRIVKVQVAEVDRREQIVQLVKSPTPSNPFCWRIITVGRDADSNHVLRAGMISLWPWMYPADRCVVRSLMDPTLPLQPLQPFATAPGVFWFGEFRAPLSELKALKEKYCAISGFLRFARAPFWLKFADSTVIGDLRYDREPELGFSEMRVLGDEKCLRWTPSWDPPTE